MVNFFPLSFETDLHFLLLFLKFLDLFSHNRIGIHLGNLLSKHAYQDLLSNLGISKLGNLVPGVLGLDVPNLILLPLLLTLISLNLQPLGFLNLLPFNLLPLVLNSSILLDIVILLKPLLSLFNDLVTCKKTLLVTDLNKNPIKHLHLNIISETNLALVASFSDPLSQLSALHLVPVGVDGSEGLVQHGHHRHELGANLLTRHALDMRALSYVSPLSLTSVCTKVDRPSPVVNTDLSGRNTKILHSETVGNSCLHVIVPGTLHNQPLHLVVGGELSQGQQELHGDEGHVPEWRSVLLDCGEVFTLIDKFSFSSTLTKRM